MSLKKAYRKIISFLNENKVDYLVIGGVASGLLGEPRFTTDIDICLFVKKKDIKSLIEKLEEAGFDLDKKQIKERIKLSQTFRVFCKDIPIDFILSSTEFEKEALKRKQIIKFQGVKANFPSVEDFIVFKIISAREKDIADAKATFIRHKERLNISYIEKWIKKFCEIAQSLMYWNNFKKIMEEE